MIRELAELKARAGECVVQARQEMDLAEKAADESHRTDHLKAALVWLKMATELRAAMQDEDGASGAPSPA